MTTRRPTPRWLRERRRLLALYARSPQRYVVPLHDPDVTFAPTPGPLWTLP